MKAKLTNRNVNALKPGSKPYEVLDTDLTGFLLRVQPSGAMTYYASYRLNGRRSRSKIGAASAVTPAQARQQAKELLASVARGIDPQEAKRKAQRHTLRAFLKNEYEPWAREHRKWGGAANMIRSAFSEFLDLTLDKIDVRRIEDWRSKLLKDGKAPATCDSYVARLNAALNHAVRLGVIDANPMAGVKLLRKDNQRVRFLSTEERKRLLSALDSREERIRAERRSANQWREERGYNLLPDLDAAAYADHLKPMVLISLNTGLRRGELFHLRWTDIDFERRQLTVRGEVAKSGRKRVLPMNSDVHNVLLAWKAQQQGTSWLVFPSENGRPFDNVNTAWRAILKAADIEGFRWHDMRHDFASQLVMAGATLNDVRDLMGHANLDMTLRYAHLSPDHRAEAVERIAGSQKAL